MLKSFKLHFKCSVISLIIFALCLLYMQNLEVKNAILTTRKTKSEIKKELEDFIANDRKNENTDIQQTKKRW